MRVMTGGLSFLLMMLNDLRFFSFVLGTASHWPRGARRLLDHGSKEATGHCSTGVRQPVAQGAQAAAGPWKPVAPGGQRGHLPQGAQTAQGDLACH